MKLVRPIEAIVATAPLLALLACWPHDNGEGHTSKPGESEQSSACQERAARALGRVYWLANPLSDPADAVRYVLKDPVMFASDGPAIRCAEKLGNWLLQAGLSSISQGDRDLIYERALKMGSTARQADEVARSVSSGAVDAFVMGQELLWLAQVLPQGASGNWDPYLSTGTPTREQARQLLPVYRQLLVQDPAMVQIMDDMMAQFGPIVEEQIVTLASSMAKARE